MSCLPLYESFHGILYQYMYCTAVVLTIFLCVFLSSRMGENLEESLPNLDTLILSNNSLQELGDIDVLSSVKTLSTLR